MRNVTIISVQEFDNLVQKTYGKIYSYQQQDDCKDRGTEYVDVPAEPEDYQNDFVGYEINKSEMGVSFKAWLERDPKQLIPGQSYDGQTALWWSRHFYPHVSMIVNDLHSKGLLPAGELGINIDW